MRKRQRYGTIIVDLERRCALDLLPDRTADTLSLWLRDRPGIALVARDRSPEYARGIAAGAPDAVQTADRWHLLFNIRQMVERWAAGAHGRLRPLPSIVNTDIVNRQGNEGSSKFCVHMQGLTDLPFESDRGG